jgi:hypothetical protein
MTYDEFVGELEVFVNDLPAEIERSFRSDGRDFWLNVKPLTAAHRELTINGSSEGIEYELGKIWSEPMAATPEVFSEVLAACDAIRSGAVRECRDLRTGVRYHIYRLKTRGVDRFCKDGQYSLWHWTLWRWLGVKVRKVSIQRLPPLKVAS